MFAVCTHAICYRIPSKKYYFCREACKMSFDTNLKILSTLYWIYLTSQVCKSAIYSIDTTL